MEPKPKKMGILSLRTPVRAYGTFKQPDFQIEKGPLLLRAGGAVALAATAPLAALLPLVETDLGTATNCGAVHREAAAAIKQAQPLRRTKSGR